MKVTLLGILAFLPLLVYSFLVYLFISVALFNNGTILNSPYLPFIMITVPVVWGTLIFYIINAIKNKELQGHNKAIWLFAVIIVGFIALPIYWYKFIFKK